VYQTQGSFGAAWITRGPLAVLAPLTGTPPGSSLLCPLPSQARPAGAALGIPARRRPHLGPRGFAGGTGCHPGPRDPLPRPAPGEGRRWRPCPGPQMRVLVLNKVDAVKDKKLLLPLAAHYGHLPGFQRYPTPATPLEPSPAT